MSRVSENELSEKVRPLFVAGCPRSGTTAFANYLNQHPEILVCRERYHGIPSNRLTRDYFTFKRILDFRPKEMKPQRPENWMKYHVETLAKKDPAKLKWIGDKYPLYVHRMRVLERNNPGARFIVLYRPLQEVAESWEARSKEPNDLWLGGKNGFEMAVERWNLALKKTREFIENSSTPRVLIVSYRDFFYQTEAIAPLIFRFLQLEFDASVTKAWKEASLEFESGRRPKKPLSEEQKCFIQEYADLAAEAWILERIEKQRREPGLYIEESREAALASLNEVEGQAWRLQQRVKTLERDFAQAKKKIRKLAAQKKNLRDSRTWRLLTKLNHIRTKI